MTAVLGSQWGDEGKGKLVDLLCQETDLCCRCQGGNNAGHTIVHNGTKYDFHLLPSGMVNEKCVNVIGNGVVIHIQSFFDEIETNKKKGLDSTGRIFVSERAHIVFDFHQIVDGLKEIELGGSSIGTTKRGIGPAYSAKASRSGLRIHHLMQAYEQSLQNPNDPNIWRNSEFIKKFIATVENRHKRYGSFDYNIESEIERYKIFAQKLKPYVIDTVQYLNEAIKSKKRILIEGANAALLDIDFGTYPYVTSSNCSIGGCCTGLGIPPQVITKVYGVVKAYTTRVGGGPFPTEQLNEIGEHFQTVGAEFGVTTGRKRRCGWLDTVVLNYSHMVNGYTHLNITKLDVLDKLDVIKIGIRYLIDGKPLKSFPSDLDVLSKVVVEYESHPGWKTDISKCRKFEDLPENARKYIKRIEELVGVPVEYIGVGPGRDAMIRI